ncbi:VQ motif-containing protein 8, chloroplastic-like [Tasmannia lanceolata]|uniref:VQ motif-containing protein 8, chloroplastic-like n=1 Tax=Tasmannia lanceolata TaxID=3420 RepID=UPI0040641EEC
MIPSHYNNDQETTREINGHRPSPLKINKESHIIQKTSSSSSSNSITSSVTGASGKPPLQQQHRHPVIIYTHSPKVIHAHARDFMAVVQKLTGLSQSDDPPPPVDAGNASLEENNMRITDNAMLASVLTDENCDLQVSSASMSPMFDPTNSYFSDIPLFTPNSSEFFCSTRPFYRYPDSGFSPLNMGSSISPSVMEVLKAFPEY